MYEFVISLLPYAAALYSVRMGSHVINRLKLGFRSGDFPTFLELP